MLGTAACVGLWTFGVEPPSDLRKAAGTTTPPAGVGAGRTGGPGQGGTGQDGGGQAAAAKVSPAERLARGEIDKVDVKDLVADENNKADLVNRADYNWLKYLQDMRGNDPQAELSADAEPVKAALVDLAKAIEDKNADAYFLRGQIYQELGKLKEAEADFKAGAELFKDDPEKSARFTNALRALRLAASRAHLLPPELPPQALAMILIGLQPAEGAATDGEKKDDKKPKAPAEAGYAFFEALELVGTQKFAEAQKKLAEARKRHNQRRFLLPRRPQNPDSDPREDIFLKACDQLSAYWALLAKLNDPKYTELAAKDRIPAVDKLLASARQAMLQEVAGKLAKGKGVKSVDDLVKLVTAERAESVTLATDLKDAKTKLAAKTKEAEGLTDSLAKEKTARTKAEEDRIKTRGLLIKSEAREKNLKSSGDAAVSALKQVGDAVGSKFVDVKTSAAALVKDVKDARSMAAMKDPKGEVKRLEGELATAKSELSRRWSPVEMLAAWRDALPGDTVNALGDQALKDVARVEALPTATAEQKAQAHLVRGLVLKNQEKYAEAQAALQKAKAGLADARGDWLKRATAALDMVSNPGADAANRAADLQRRGKPKEALAVLERGLKSLKTNKGPLYAQRARVAFEAALAKGKLDEKDELLAAARKDAKQAADEKLPVGHYLLGRISEGLGDLADAEKHYRAAAAAEKDAGTAARYKIALARVLLRKGGETRPGGVGQAPQKAAPLDRRARLQTASVLVALMLQPPAKAESDAEVLADEVLALGDKAPFDARAQALAIKGLYTRALTTYIGGLRDDNMLAASHASALLDLVANHPSLKRPESRTTADPLQADRHYAAGLNLFFAKKYPAAEKEFLSAVENDKADARYHYFLGLSRLAQGKREAQEDFDTAAELERLGRPDRAAVAAALERVQGPMRRALNDARTRPVKEGK